MPSSAFFLALGAGSTACIATTMGILIISRYQEWARRHAVYFMGFASGMLVAVSLVHLIPRSLSLSPHASFFLPAGFIGLYLVNRLLHLYICHDESHGVEYATGILLMVGIGIHSVIDGVMYSITFTVGTFTGVIAAVGMILHELPEGIVTFVALERGELSSKKAAAYAFLAAGLTTPVGTAFSYPFIGTITGAPLGFLLAATAGGLLYVGASHLLPSMEREDKPWAILSLLAGVLTATAIILTKHGGHG